MKKEHQKVKCGVVEAPKVVFAANGLEEVVVENGPKDDSPNVDVVAGLECVVETLKPIPPGD